MSINLIRTGFGANTALARIAVTGTSSPARCRWYTMRMHAGTANVIPSPVAAKNPRMLRPVSGPRNMSSSPISRSNTHPTSSPSPAAGAESATAKTSSAPTAETFSAPSKPGLYYTRPASGGSSRELPRVRSPLVPILSLSLFGLSAWAAFLLYATNQEKLASSVVRHVLQSVRDCEEVGAVLGGGVLGGVGADGSKGSGREGELKRSAGSGSKVEPEGKWWLGGDAWVWGKINLPAGNVDLSFRLKGPGGSGTLYFTSIRKAKGEAFTPLRFRVIADDGRVVNVLESLRAQGQGAV